MSGKTNIREHQNSLVELYKASPEDAKVTDHARTTGFDLTDPFHGKVEPGSEKLEGAVSADVDLRGTLVVDREVPVGFQSIECEVNIKGEEGTDPEKIKKLLRAAEYSCVVLQTLRSGVPVEAHLNLE